jgi:hypothetical protein
MPQTAIFGPVFAMVFLTFAVWFIAARAALRHFGA